MSIRQTTIAKLQQLPESLLPEVSNFIDFVMHKHQSGTANQKEQDDVVAKAWEKWFEGVDRLKLTPGEMNDNTRLQNTLSNKTCR